MYILYYYKEQPLSFLVTHLRGIRLTNDLSMRQRYFYIGGEWWGRVLKAAKITNRTITCICETSVPRSSVAMLGGPKPEGLSLTNPFLIVVSCYKCYVV